MWIIWGGDCAVAKSAKPGWSDKELEASIAQYDGNGYNQDVDGFAQFTHAVQKFLRKRLRLYAETMNTASSVFLMGRLPDGQTVARDARVFTASRHDPSGCIWFGRERLNAAAGLPLPEGADDAALFDHVVTVLKVGDLPAVLYDAIDGSVRIYPEGMADADNCVVRSISGLEVSLDYIKALLDKLHLSLFITPVASESQAALWKKRDSAHPANEAEHEIQKVLYVAFHTLYAFGYLKVEQEHVAALGRCDFILKEQDPVEPGTWKNHAILELKVVKSFTYTGSKVTDSANQKAVTHGLDQARDYRTSFDCTMSALCCFDMRKTPDPEEAVAHEVGRAEKEGIGLWSWPIHHITKNARSANTELIAADKTPYG